MDFLPSLKKSRKMLAEISQNEPTLSPTKEAKISLLNTQSSSQLEISKDRHNQLCMAFYQRAVKLNEESLQSKRLAQFYLKENQSLRSKLRSNEQARQLLVQNTQEGNGIREELLLAKVRIEQLVAQIKLKDQWIQQLQLNDGQAYSKAKTDCLSAFAFRQQQALQQQQQLKAKLEQLSDNLKAATRENQELLIERNALRQGIETALKPRIAELELKLAEQEDYHQASICMLQEELQSATSTMLQLQKQLKQEKESISNLQSIIIDLGKAKQEKESTNIIQSIILDLGKAKLQKIKDKQKQKESTNNLQSIILDLGKATQVQAWPAVPPIEIKQNQQAKQKTSASKIADGQHFSFKKEPLNGAQDETQGLSLGWQKQERGSSKSKKYNYIEPLFKQIKHDIKSAGQFRHSSAYRRYRQ